MVIDVDDLYNESIEFIVRSENELYSKSQEERRKEFDRFNEMTMKYDEDRAWALYVHPNSNEYMREVLTALELEPKDIILDIGCGDMRLGIIALQEFCVDGVIAIDINKDWIDNSIQYIKDKYEFPKGLSVFPQAYQDFKFPKCITKAVFLAWHNGPKTLNEVRIKLAQTDCRLFIHNFGYSGSVQIENMFLSQSKKGHHCQRL